MLTKSTHITWYGHANVLIEFGGRRVLLDPFFSGNPLAPDWKDLPKLDLLLLTHDHGDHLGDLLEIAQTQQIPVGCTVEVAQWLKGQGLDSNLLVNASSGGGWNLGGYVEFKGWRIHMVPALHSVEHGLAVGFVLELPQGPCIYHAGDTALFADMQIMRHKFSLDLALLPVGGLYTMDGRDAAQACVWLKTRLALPLHYKTFPALAQDAVDFVRYLSQATPHCRAIVPEPGQSLRLEDYLCAP